MKPLPADDCGFAAALNVVSGKWKMAILWEIHPSPRRFGELRRLLNGVSEKVLTEQLRQMEADGLIRRTVYPGAVQRVEYSVTQIGLSLNTAINAMSDWGKMHGARAAASQPPNLQCIRSCEFPMIFLMRSLDDGHFRLALCMLGVRFCDLQPKPVWPPSAKIVGWSRFRGHDKKEGPPLRTALPLSGRSPGYGLAEPRRRYALRTSIEGVQLTKATALVRACGDRQ